ncbi:hypothetical protein P8864_00880 [Priestia flexa]|uniref:hypothetical protein n=1 Tax=Priestia flexa TaxID=86664 RepID=UPI000C24D5B0|nr:hypothetical protein [Priestia flexa]MEC0664515.1 hypothetical protein [Priestia flexa]
MNQKVINRTGILFGFTLGIFSSFFLTVTVLKSYFDKPWDLFWSSINGIVSALIGGVIAYIVAHSQIKAQNYELELKEKKAQSVLAWKIEKELSNNLSIINKINKLLTMVQSDFKQLSQEIANGNQTILEGICFHTNFLEITLLSQLRNSLSGIEYIDLYKLIDILEQINKAANYLQLQKDQDYIYFSLQKLLDLTTEFINLIEKQKEIV